jgi:peptidoglycan/LPS O-acetylase OafA/YrhL
MKALVISQLSKDTEKQRSKLYLLQVFRGLAALLVVMVHGELIFYAFGGSGVDFFFVLSGFIITYIHSKDIGKTQKIKSFILKRFIRIYPLYWLILTSKLIASFGFAYGNTDERSLLEIIKAFSLFPQDRIILSESFLGVSWTLSYELFFYLGFCLLIVFKPKFYLPIIGLWFLGIFLNFTHLIELPANSVIIQFLLSELHLEFLLGCLAAYIVMNYRVEQGIYLIGLGLFFYTLAAINTNFSLFPLSDVIAYGIPATILVIGAVSLETRKKLIIPYLFLLLGDASYSIYLIHGFIINNITKITIKLNLLELATQNAITLSLFSIFNAIVAVACGCLVYLLLEKPIITNLRSRIIRM